MIDIGISVDQSEVHNLVLAVPNNNSDNAVELTKMANSVSQFESAQNLDGYSDYRGVKVIGTWK